MKIRDSFVCASVLLIALVRVDLVFSQTPIACKNKCSEPPPQGGQKQVIVDASKTGQRIIKKYGTDDEVVVIIGKKNPYRYSYKTTIESRLLSEDLVRDFFRTVEFPSLKKIFPVPFRASKRCDDANFVEKIGEFQTLRQKLRRQIGDVEILLKMKEYADQYDAFLEETLKSNIGCESVCSKGNALYPKLTKLIGYAAPQIEQDALNNVKNSLEAAEDALPTEENEQQESCQKVLEGKKAEYDNLNNLFEFVGKFEESKKHFKALKVVLEEVAEDPESFNETVHVPQSNQPTNTTLAVFRTDWRDPNKKEETVVIVDIDSGEVPLSLSAGIGFSTINDVEIIRQTSLGDDMTTVNTFGFKSNSSFKPSGVSILNGHLFELGTKRPVTVGASGGLVVSSRGGNNQLEYILGPSLGFQNNLIWMTFGFHAARVPQLAGGFSIGDRVPQGLQDPLPVQRNFKLGFMYALTFKVR